MPYGRRRSRARRIVESTSRKASGWRRMEAIVVKIKLRLRGETKWPYLRRASLARTSPQDLAADGLRACARRRLASSLRCASVTVMASGVATRLSQSSSISSSRSSTLSERACLSTVLMSAFSAGSPQAARIMSVRITAALSGRMRARRVAGPLKRGVRRFTVDIVQELHLLDDAVLDIEVNALALALVSKDRILSCHWRAEDLFYSTSVRPDIEAVTHFPLRRGDHCRDRPELLVWFDKPVKLKAVESQSSIYSLIWPG